MSDDLRRTSDEVLWKLVQKVEDYMVGANDWRKKHDDEAAAFRADTDKRLKSIEEFQGRVDWAYKLLLGLAALIGMAVHAWTWCRDHVK